jgi:hypothetical protein
MIRRAFQTILTIAALAALPNLQAQDKRASSAWQEEFNISNCKLVTTGRNPYFVLEPGFQLTLEGGGTKLQITVLNETKTVDGVLTRVVEEKEWKDGEVFEIAKNYFVMCEQTKDVFYFGEEVDFYEKGKVVKHDGSWLAGNGNRFGMIMPGAPKLKAKFYQEIAPGTAMDRAEIVSLTDTCKTPAGTFSKCMKVKEGTALNVLETEYKHYAPAIGLAKSGDLVLVKYGMVKN